MYLKPLIPIRLLYVYAVIGIVLVLAAIFWFTFHFIFWILHPIATDLSIDLETNGTQYTQVDSFFLTVDNYALIIVLLVLFVWAIVYAQRKGEYVA